ncbi:MAG TPA: hypothetical protein PLT54_07435 [Rhodoferax sp.]|nr:hypothetical protein [Rhodoferax sp.]HQY76553.1 hypothetical protein [Rhodoferax sp.]
MNHRLASAVALLLFGGLPHAQATAQGFAVERDASIAPVRAAMDDETQRRKADLRATLQSQQAGQAAQATRQLTQQDRAELRQQLRQQRREESRQ